MNLSRLKLRQKLLILLFSVGGIGLASYILVIAMVKRIIESQNGDIWIESQGDGQGSCFCFTLPVQRGT